MNIYDKIKDIEGLSADDKYFWSYQYRLGKEVVVPYLSRHNFFQQGNRVMEIGSAEGGVLAAFVEAGAKDALATDIAKNRLEIGKKISEKLNLPIDFSYHNILNDNVPDDRKAAADLVILRDVIEHLDDTALALNKIKEFIKPGGYLYITFPPYYSPFGGHQHNLKNFWGKLPYLHFLPDPIFQKLIASGRPADVIEVKRLRNIRMTPAKFLSAAENCGYSLRLTDYYLLRPVFKMKFGLPSVKITRLASLPPVRNFLSLEASYVLQVK